MLPCWVVGMRDCARHLPRARQSSAAGDFYGVVPYEVIVSLFGLVALFVLVVLTIGVRRCWKGFEEARIRPATRPKPHKAEIKAALAWKMRALRDVLTLRHLHASGDDCVSGEELRRPWRRWFHYCTFYGFLLCFASTTVAAIYYSFFGLTAPYG